MALNPKKGRLFSMGLSFESLKKLEILANDNNLTKSQFLKFCIDMMFEVRSISQKVEHAIDQNEPLKIQADGYGLTLTTDHIKDLSDTIQNALNTLQNGIVIVPPKGKKDVRHKPIRPRKAA